MLNSIYHPLAFDFDEERLRALLGPINLLPVDDCADFLDCEFNFDFEGEDIILPSLVFFLNNSIFTIGGLPIAGVSTGTFQLQGLNPERYYDDNGNKIGDFILNQDPFTNSKILIAGKNFGCGSSREHAPWALLDFGITCVISSSFADIFFNNCFKNGILPIILDEDKIKELSEYANRKEEISVDLNEEKIIYGNNEVTFEVDKFKKKCLLEGLDDIALSLKKSDKIENFEKNLKNQKPWIIND